MNEALGVAIEVACATKMREFEDAFGDLSDDPSELISAEEVDDSEDESGGAAGEGFTEAPPRPVLSNKARVMFRAVYAHASARVRVTDNAGKRVYSKPFPIRRGVVQGGIFSPLCFIIALELIMRRHSGACQEDAVSDDLPELLEEEDFVQIIFIE